MLQASSQLAHQWAIALIYLTASWPDPGSYHRQLHRFPSHTLLASPPLATEPPVLKVPSPGPPDKRQACVHRTRLMQRICGVPTSDYLDHPENSSIKVIFHSSCKGFILWAVASSHYDEALLNIGDGRAPLTKAIDRFLCCLWEMGNMHHSGLKVFMETWLGIMVGIAEASVKFSAGSLGEAVLAEWEQDPEKAYRWLKSQMREYQGEISDIDSQAPTTLSDLNIPQRAQVEAKKQAVERRGRVAPPNLNLWLIKNSSVQQWTAANKRILEINERLDTDLDEAARKALEAEGEKLTRKQDELVERYKEAGGQNF
ncbi:uncharacterized protein NECHADRAFT_88845 [Fusarium vanettenii 77-13-4]|uniref:Uncharacterized protein n=1 Tax=Fusarium vanettenii (strain ATCC MYA-4622 / CBS 123669 / FGSC 9596 / NRRL 45880 / 77-13-4) TaxID=660122 RepID=C7ZN65_FUSV7|nr:uncharacterized protein NECHADRAFT_88845 [Fusarium vanettenii 77-13-4]EEU34550.1 predicted protein [Fusarium vanettenii 77-13-4]